MENHKKHEIIPELFILKAIILFAAVVLFLIGSGIVSAETISESVTITGETVITEDTVIAGAGNITVSGNLAFSGASVSFTDLSEGSSPVILVESGGTLTFSESTLDLTDIAAHCAINVLDGGSLYFDKSQVKNGKRPESDDPVDAFFIEASNAEIRFANGSAVTDNINPKAGVLFMDGGTFTMDETTVSGNRAKMDETNAAAVFFLMNTDNAISDSEITGNGQCVFDIQNSESTEFTGTLYQGNGLREDDPEPAEGEYVYATIIVNHTNLTIGDDNLFEDNNYEGATVFGAYSDISIGKSSFVRNHPGEKVNDSSDAVIESNHSPVTVSEGAVFTENGCECIFIWTGELKIEDDVTFSANKDTAVHIHNNQGDTSTAAIGEAIFQDNQGKQSGGAIISTLADLTVSGAKFTGNSAAGNGGAMEIYGGKVTLSDAVFENNSGGSVGGAAFIWHQAETVIQKCVFTNNSSGINGGALMVGDGMDDLGTSTVRIKEAEFTGNTSASSGSAIYIAKNGAVYTSKAALTDNSGGGIRSGAGSRTFIRPINGAAIFENTADGAPEGLQDLYQLSGTAAFMASEAMFNGGKHQWKTAEADGGTYYGSDPTDKDISAALVLISENAIGSGETADTADSTGKDAAAEVNSSFGGAIANFGLLEIGEGNENNERDDRDRPHRFYRLPELPNTGFSAVRPVQLSEKPLSLNYKPLQLTLGLPSQSIQADIVRVPFRDGEYPVEWLGSDVGLLEDFAMPGEGRSVIIGHNHLNDTEAGPFAFLLNTEKGDLVTVLDEGNRLQVFHVYANEKIARDDIASLERIAAEYEDSLVLITCEDEITGEGYMNRRIVAARPDGL